MSIAMLAIIIMPNDEAEEGRSLHEKHIFISTSVNFRKTNNPVFW